MTTTLPRQNRLRQRRVFRKIYEEGRFIASPIMVMYFLPSPVSGGRVGFSAGKKLGNAVSRNRCKRRLREGYRLFRSEAPEGLDIVIIARRALLSATWQDLRTGYASLFRRMRAVLAKKQEMR